MSMMDELRKKSDNDLKKYIAEKREELRGLRFKSAGSGMRDVKSIRTTKKEIARALTERNARARQATHQ